MNRSAKGSRMERLCLDELKQYLREELKWTIPQFKNSKGEWVDNEWKVVRSRDGGNDYFNTDVGLKAIDRKKKEHLFNVQSKSRFTPQWFKAVKDEWSFLDKSIFPKLPIHVYYAQYDLNYKKVEPSFQTKHFKFYQVI